MNSKTATIFCVIIAVVFTTAAPPNLPSEKEINPKEKDVADIKGAPISEIKNQGIEPIPEVSQARVARGCDCSSDWSCGCGDNYCSLDDSSSCSSESDSSDSSCSSESDSSDLSCSSESDSSDSSCSSEDWDWDHCGCDSCDSDSDWSDCGSNKCCSDSSSSSVCHYNACWCQKCDCNSCCCGCNNCCDNCCQNNCNTCAKQDCTCWKRVPVECPEEDCKVKTSPIQRYYQAKAYVPAVTQYEYQIKTNPLKMYSQTNMYPKPQYL